MKLCQNIKRTRMKNKKRFERIRQKNKKIKKYKKLWNYRNRKLNENVNLDEDQKNYYKDLWAIQMATTPKRCSCFLCGNPRRWFSGKNKDSLTFQEIKFHLEKDNEWIY